ncbi:hypothetical protein ACKFR8_05185 [Corynebacterium axilliensis]|uniref:hypothetical protein n=1 Tax=Corynebacterium sp. YSMAA5_1_F9 TaxID=3383591 RepID=UPI0038D19C1C
MTDLSTSTLKRLLDEERKNPLALQWTYKGAAASSIYHEYPSKHEEIYGMRVEMELSRLVALGPEVAQELLTLRDALHDLSEVWEDVSIDPARTPAEQDLAAAVVDHIDQILGDHDG